MHTPTRRGRVLAVALFAALAVLVLAACSSAPKTGSSTPPSSSPGSSSASTSTTPTSPSPSGPTKKVHVSSLEADGTVFGVGMPVILYFSPTPTDSTEFTKAVTVTVNGAPANGKWYWEYPYQGQPIQAHYRTQNPWPANATIEVKLPIGGLSAGKGLAYDGALSSVTFRTGDAHVSTVNAPGLSMTVQSNRKTVKTIPVSLGKAKTPTYNGTKLVMQKGEDTPGTSSLRPDGAVRMVGPGYDELVDWSVRVTASGEYIHAAPWNSHIGQVSTSNGCTNLGVEDAKWFYAFSLVGDMVRYVGADGALMPALDGLGDWNVPWGTWQQGGLLLNH